MLPVLVAAIAGRRVIEFDYDGHHRVAEPHIYGCINGKDQLLVYQTGGSSRSGGIPEWRRVDVRKMTGLVVVSQVFGGPRPAPSGIHSVWDQTYEIVS
jgi:hypothetical protein